MRDKDWYVLDDNSKTYNGFVTDALAAVGLGDTVTVTMSRDTLDALVMIAIGLNGCLDGGDMRKLPQDIVDHFFDMTDEDDEDDEDE